MGISCPRRWGQQGVERWCTPGHQLVVVHHVRSCGARPRRVVRRGASSELGLGRRHDMRFRSAGIFPACARVEGSSGPPAWGAGRHAPGGLLPSPRPPIAPSRRDCSRRLVHRGALYGRSSRPPAPFVSSSSRDHGGRRGPAPFVSRDHGGRRGWTCSSTSTVGWRGRRSTGFWLIKKSTTNFKLEKS